MEEFKDDFIYCDSCGEEVFEGNTIFTDETGNIFCCLSCVMDYYMPPIDVERLTYKRIEQHKRDHKKSPCTKGVKK